jgi:hypothetical protein
MDIDPHFLPKCGPLEAEEALLPRPKAQNISLGSPHCAAF